MTILNFIRWLPQRGAPGGGGPPNVVFPKGSPFFKTGRIGRRIGASSQRLNRRAEVLLRRNLEAIQGMRLLDLGSHDGRFTWASLELGATHATGIEANPDLVTSADSNLRSLGYSQDRYRFVQGDMIDELTAFAPGAIDTVLCLGVFYHTHRPIEMLQGIVRLKPMYLILDSNVVASSQARGPYFFLRKEPRAWNPSGLVLKPTREAIEFLLDHFAFDSKKLTWGPEITSPDYHEGRRVSYLAALKSSIGE